jgi:hypothetical protein
MKLYTVLAVKLLFLCFLVFGNSLPEEKNAMSHPPLIEQRNMKPTAQTGKSVQVTYHKSLCYVVSLFQDKSKAMVITFDRTSENPYPAIQEELDEGFRGSGGKGVEVFLILDGNKQDAKSAAIGNAFLDMLKKVVVFHIAYEGILFAADHGFVDGTLLKLNTRSDIPLIIGNLGHPLGPKVDTLHARGRR